MGITIIQKSDLTRKKPNARIALVLAGGAISGGTFKVGGLKALNDFLGNRKVTDFDIYVGTSAGAFLAAPLAGGISPEEILRSLDGSSEYFSQLAPLHLYTPNLKEMIGRPIKYLYRRLSYVPEIAWDVVSSMPRLGGTLKEAVAQLLSRPTYSEVEQILKPLARVIYTSRQMPSVASALPSGIFDNAPIEKYLRENMKRNHLSNNFKVLKKLRGKSLYCIATNLDTAEKVIFGHDEHNDVTISEAVQASTALPVFYKPARLKGVDYTDGSVRRSANVGVAVAKGADLIICYNPFRPFHNKLVLEYFKEKDKYISRNPRISDGGVLMVLNQVFRTLLHSRLHLGLEEIRRDKNFQGDVIMIEPRQDEFDFFEMNPLGFWNRARAAKLGFFSVKNSIEGRFDEISRILASYGIEMTREMVTMDSKRLTGNQTDDEAIFDVLENEPRRRKLKVVAGGK